jgi:hypothetical protein
MRIALGLLAAAALLIGFDGPAMADENPALSDSQTLCIASHADFPKVRALAEAQGWTAPPGAPGGMVWTKTVGPDTRTLVMVDKDGPARGDTGGGAMTVHLCVVTSKIPGPDVKAAARAVFGGQAPLADGDGVAWVFTESGGERHFLADKAEATITAAVQGGPVTVFAVGTGADGDKVVFLQLARSAAPH